MKTHDETMADRIQRTREERKLTASELARKLGVTSTAVWNWEKNGRRPRHAVLSDLSKTLGVSAEWLLSGKSERDNADAEPGMAVKSSENGKTQTVAEIIENTRRQIEKITAVPYERVKIRVEFEAE